MNYVKLVFFTGVIFINITSLLGIKALNISNFAIVNLNKKLGLEDVITQQTETLAAEDRASLIWTGAEFAFPDAAIRRTLVQSGKYINRNIIATRCQFWNDKVIAVFPRYKPGVTATVGYISALTDGKLTRYKLGKTSALLDSKLTGRKIDLLKALIRTTATKRTPVWQPFPNWNMQQEGNCDALQSAVDIFVDSQGRAWILDSGITNTLDAENTRRRCPPKIIVVSIRSLKVVRLIDLSTLTTAESRVQYLCLDDTISGKKYVYVADAANRALLVWDISSARGWRILLPSAALPEGTSPDVLYITLVRRPADSKSPKILYFTYLTSPNMFSIRAEFLRQINSNGRAVNVGTKPAKIIILGNDGGTSIFFRFEGHKLVFRWDTQHPFESKYFELVYSGQNDRLTTHVVPEYETNRMMALESNFPDFITSIVGAGASHTLSPLAIDSTAISAVTKAVL